jgi:hypothetical protein
MEAMVVMTLTAILLGCLMGYLRFATGISAKADGQLLPELQKSYAQQRLNAVLTEIIPQGKRGACFTTPERNRLYFYYNNGPDSEPTFCGDVMAELWLDSSNRLALTIWPSPKRWGRREESRTSYLLDEVESVSFSFFQPPIQDEMPKGPTGWLEHWKSDEEGLPAMIRVELTMLDKQTEKMIFLPTLSGKPILYLQDRVGL